MAARRERALPGLPRDIYPFDGHYLEHRGMGYHYLDEGQGEPLVMVHGNPTWSIYYRHLVLGLRDRYRCIVPDHIGCGLSDKPSETEYDYRLASRIDDLERLIEHLAFERPITLIVHDWGGMIGMGYAVRHPERIRRIVVLNTAAFHLPEGLRVPSSISMVRDSALSSLFVQGGNGFARTAAHWCTRRRPMSRRLRDAYCAPYNSWHNRLATLRFVQDIPLKPEDASYQTVSDIEAGLPRLADKPMLLCWGGKDFVFNRAVLGEWRKRFPKAQVRELLDCGHYVLEDAPDEVAAQVRTFLRETEREEGGPLANGSSSKSAAQLAEQGLSAIVSRGPAHVAACLRAVAAKRPERVAIMVPEGEGSPAERTYQELTYRELDQESDRLAAGLAAIGIGRGVRTVLMVKPSAEFFLLAFAMAKVGAVPVLIDPGIGRRHLKTCLAEAQPEAFIGTTTAHAARACLGWAKETLRTYVCVGRPSFPGALPLDAVRQAGAEQGLPFAMAEFEPDETAAVLFTSGSTGVPKGVLYSHGNFAAQIAMLRQIAGELEGEVDLPTFPVFALFDPALGMTTVIPRMDPTRPAEVDPLEIIETVRRFDVTNMFASPALLNRVASYGIEHGATLPSLKRVISAGAPVHHDVMRRFLSLLPRGARIVTPYGATEGLPVSVIDSDALLATRDDGAPAADSRASSRPSGGIGGVCVGRPVPPTEVCIIAIDDGVIETMAQARRLAPGQVGEIVAVGPQMTARYLNRAASTELAKIYDGPRVHHRMGDLGYFAENGELWFCGRKAHRVQAGEETLYSVPCEVVFNRHEKVYRSALVGPQVHGRVVPTIIVQLHQRLPAAEERALASELLALAKTVAHCRAIERVLFHAAFPVDIRHNAKIDRAKLALWSEKRLA